MELIKLCTRDSCCPTYYEENGKVYIQDDFGGKVMLTKEEALLFASKIQGVDSDRGDIPC